MRNGQINMRDTIGIGVDGDGLSEIGRSFPLKPKI